MKIIISFFLIFLTFSARAQTLDSVFYDWTVYEIAENGETKCYIISYPKEQATNFNSRKSPYIMITRYKNRRIEEFSLYSGFEYKLNSEVLVMVDSKKFLLETNGDMAWMKNRYGDIDIIQTMLTSLKLKARADSSLASFAIDEYSLKGVAKAYARMKYICS